MKNLILSAVAVLVMFGLVSAQMKLLDTFEGNVFCTEECSPTGFQYDFKGYWSILNHNTLKIYEEDFSLRSTMNFDGSPATSYGILFLSEKLFNTDNKLEFLVHYIGSSKIYNEDGEVLKEFDDCYIKLCLTPKGEYIFDSPKL